MFLMYARAHVPTRVGVVTHHPLRSTISPPNALMGVDFVPLFRSVA